MTSARLIFAGLYAVLMMMTSDVGAVAVTKPLEPLMDLFDNHRLEQLIEDTIPGETSEWYNMATEMHYILTIKKEFTKRNRTCRQLTVKATEGHSEYFLRERFCRTSSGDWFILQ